MHRSKRSEMYIRAPASLLTRVRLSSAATVAWARTPSGARRVATAHYVSLDSKACFGEEPFVLRMHHYCPIGTRGRDISIFTQTKIILLIIRFVDVNMKILIPGKILFRLKRKW